MNREITHATRTRRLTADNVHEAAPLLRGRTMQALLEEPEVIATCRSLLAEGSMMGVLIDSVVVGTPPRLVGVGGGAFVSRAFVQAEREQTTPGLAERVLRSVLARAPVTLSRRQIAEANEGEGLCLAVVLHHWRESESEEVQRQIRHHLMSGFLQDVRGYHLVEVLAECLGEFEINWALAGGFRLRTDYATWYSAHSEPLPRRFLAGITRDEALGSEGSTLSMVFHYIPPRLRFTQSQRRLLNAAILHKTDAEISAALGVSLSAVKKTWAAIFEKASEVFPEMTCVSGSEDANQSARRGAQKRHLLLTYLLEHPEELRP